MNTLKVCRETGYLNGFKIFPHKMLINYKGEKSNYTVKKSSRHHLNQIIRVKVISPRVD